MSKTEIPEDIAALTRKIGKPFESELDLTDSSRLLKKMAVGCGAFVWSRFS